MRYGYVRVSTIEQNVDRQVKKMISLGIDTNCLYVDHASGKNMDRPEWVRLNERLMRGDTLYIDSLDRLGRSYDLVTKEWKRLTHERGIDICTLDLDIFDSSKFRAMGDIGRVVEDMLLSLLSYVAETERNKILKRQAEGIAAAKERGVYTGSSKKTLDEDTIERVNQALKGEGKRAAAKEAGVSVQTIYNMIADGRLTL